MDGGTKDKFTREEIEAVVSRFRQYVVHHRNLVTAQKEIKDAIYEPGSERVVLLIAPSHAGKSTLLRNLVDSVKKDFSDEMRRDEGFIPMAYMEAPPTKYGSYNWNTHFILGLEAVNEPLIQKKIIPASEIIKDGPSKYERAFEKCIRNRKMIAFAIDEAQHIGRSVRGDKFLNQFDVLKSLVNRTGVSHVLCGVYELKRLINVSGQFINRMKVIHFPRYLMTDEDLRVFGSVILSLRTQLPIESEFFEEKYLEYCYYQTIGCVGILGKWLAASVADALNNGAKKLTIDHLQKHAWTKDSLDILLREAKEGEEALESALVKTSYKEFINNKPENQTSSTTTDNKQEKPQKSCFERNAVWDEVGSPAFLREKA